MNAMDTMIHIDESLDSDQKLTLEAALRDMQGVVAPRINKPHLLVIAYDRDAASANTLLGAVQSRGHRAQLVGTPKGRLSRLEQDLLGKPWQQAGHGVASSCWRRTASCTSRRRVRTAWRRSAPCAGIGRGCDSRLPVVHRGQAAPRGQGLSGAAAPNQRCEEPPSDLLARVRPGNRPGMGIVRSRSRARGWRRRRRTSGPTDSAERRRLRRARGAFAPPPAARRARARPGTARRAAWRRPFPLPPR